MHSTAVGRCGSHRTGAQRHAAAAAYTPHVAAQTETRGTAASVPGCEAAGNTAAQTAQFSHHLNELGNTSR